MLNNQQLQNAIDSLTIRYNDIKNQFTTNISSRYTKKIIRKNNHFQESMLGWMKKFTTETLVNDKIAS